MSAILYEYGAFDQLSARHELLAALPVIMALSLNFHIFEFLPKSHSNSLKMQTGLGRGKLIDHQLALGCKIHNLRSVKFSKEITEKIKRVLLFSFGKNYIIADSKTFFITEKPT